MTTMTAPPPVPAAADAPPATPATPPATTPTISASDWRTTLAPELRENPLLKDFKGPDDVVKAYIGASDWKASLPAELKDDPTIKGVKDIPAMADMLVRAQKLVGAKGIIKPGKDATPEEIGAYYNAIGRPEKPEGYKLPVENMPDGIKLDDGLVNSFRTFAHENGITEQAFGALIRYQANMVAQQSKAAQDALESTVNTNVDALRKEWGQAYDQNDRLATRAIETYGGPEALEWMKQNPTLATNPALVKLFAKMGREISDDTIRGGGPDQNYQLSPADAKLKISQKMGDKAFTDVYFNAQHAGHAAAKAEMTRLHEIANPEPAPT